MHSGKSLRFHRRDIKRATISIFCTIAMLPLLSCKSSSKQDQSIAPPQPTATRQPIAQRADRPPVKMQPINIVLITLDTVRADHLHCYGYKKIETPTIDDLARRGVLFEKAVTQAPLTDPSHASIFTGTNPNVHGVRDTGGFVLQPSSVTLATILQTDGWDTGAFVSASVLKKSFGLNQGFSAYDDQMPGSNDGSGFQRAASRPANITVDHAVSWLNTRTKQPFFLWVHLYDAHEPYNPPPQFRKHYQNDLYDAEIAFIDQQLGRLLAAVNKKSPAGRTLIVLLADHGEGLGQHGEYSHGTFLYDSTLRIPWIMVGPGIPAGLRIQQQAREIDVLPTILDLLGGKASSAVQGTSMADAFSGKPVPATYSYEETLYPKINMGWSELRGIHTAHWMYVRAPKPELYDLDQDPGELNNIIGGHPKEYRELEQQLKILSGAGAENVVAHQMDQGTMEQLESLGYVGGASGTNVQLDGQGADPKDRVSILKIIDAVQGHGAAKFQPSQKIALLQQGLAEDPTNPSLYYSLGEQYALIGQGAQALQVYLDALHHGIQNGMIFTRLGNLYVSAGDKKDAIAYFQQAAQLGPHNAEAQCNLANAYMLNGQGADAERIFRSVVAAQPYAPAYNGLGVIAMKSHDLTDAQRNFERAVKLDPDYAEAMFNLGLVCMQTKDLPCARNAYKAFLVKAPAAYKTYIPQVKAQLAHLR